MTLLVGIEARFSGQSNDMAQMSSSSLTVCGFHCAGVQAVVGSIYVDMN